MMHWKVPVIVHLVSIRTNYHSLDRYVFTPGNSIAVFEKALRVKVSWIFEFLGREFHFEDAVKSNDENVPVISLNLDDSVPAALYQFDEIWLNGHCFCLIFPVLAIRYLDADTTLHRIDKQV